MRIGVSQQRLMPSHLGNSPLARGMVTIRDFSSTSQGKRFYFTGSSECQAEATSIRVENTDIGRLEAVLFIAREPLSIRKLAQLANLEDGTAARTLVQELNERYDLRHSAFRVEKVAGGYQLLTRPTYSKWLQRSQPKTETPTQLSTPALETLSVVAYRQPILRAELEAIRGVKCGEILRQLLERDLIRIAGKSNELGRPFFYATTKKFLQMFGLQDIEDLPHFDRLCRNPEEELEESSEELEPVSHSGTSTDNPQAKDSDVKSQPEEFTTHLAPEDETATSVQVLESIDEDDLEEDEYDEYEVEEDDDEEDEDYWEEVDDEDDDDDDWDDDDEDDDDDWDDDDEDDDWDEDEDDDYDDEDEEDDYDDEEDWDDEEDDD
ncbi:Segregation and condensation protein B [Planctomycetales bacterium 10988]|nr:Segregation and condensation protein B [Planctomycetales bacterium 10988]